MEARASERGAVSVFMAILSIAIIASVGLVVDGGRRLAAVREASDIAENAARAGAQAIAEGTTRTDGKPLVDTSLIESYVAAYCARPAVAASISSCEVEPNSGPGAALSVQVRVEIEPASFFYSSKPVSAVGVATGLDG